jgi:effector-binding domain-containing protein
MGQQEEIVHKRVEDTLVASIRFRGEHGEVAEQLETLRAVCQGAISGPEFRIYRFGTSHEPGVDIEVGFPVSEAVESGAIKSRVLEGFDAVAIVHRGPSDTMGESYGKLWRYVRAQGLPGGMFEREVILERGETPAGNVTEIQVPLHAWNDLLAENVERLLGAAACDEIMQGVEAVTPTAGPEPRAAWLRGAIGRLEALADDDQRLDILCRCAHVFPQERIDHLRGVYERTHDVDEVLAEMAKDPGWYAHPVRDGDVITVKKLPFDRRNYERATTEAEKRRAFCHCAMIHGYLDTFPATFCYCGAGWYRRLWEGILDRPVRVALVQSLLKGDDECEVAIHLPAGA